MGELKLAWELKLHARLRLDGDFVAWGNGNIHSPQGEFVKLDDMPIYNKSLDIAKKFRKFYKCMDKSDQFSIGQQMLRSSISIPSNISEGVGRNSSDKMLLTYLGYAKGSLLEFSTQLHIIEDDYYENELYKQIKENIILIDIEIFKFISYLEKKNNKFSK